MKQIPKDPSHSEYQWFYSLIKHINKPEFTSVIFIHYKPQIAVAILDL